MLRTLAALGAALALAVVVAPVGTTATTQPQTAQTALAALDTGVLQQLNAIRVAHGLVPLKLSAALTASATQHTEEMGTDGYFQHASADGTLFWKRIEHWYPEGSFGYWSVGENLLWSSPDVNAPAAMQLWMNSPEHRANILAARWREIGISAIHFASAGGTYENQPVTIITTDFGVRH